MRKKITRGRTYPLVITLVLLLTLAVTVPVYAAEEDGTYAISFKAGAHGSVNGSPSVTENLGYETALDLSHLTVVCDQGYYFTGWSPEVDTTVTEKATYVAQYARIINEAVYRVSYVDHYGNEMATQKAAITNAGTTVTENALAIEGYVVDSASKQVEVAAKGTQITFVYTAQSELTTTETVETVVLPDGQTVATTGGLTAGTAADGNAPGITATDGAVTNGTTGDTTNQQGQTTTVDENNVPLANQNLDGAGGPAPWVYVAMGAGVLLVAGLILFIIKQQKNHKS